MAASLKATFNYVDRRLTDCHELYKANWLASFG